MAAEQTQRLTEPTEAHLTQYLDDLRRCTNETAKRETFAVLLGRLFPGAQVGKVTAGAEHSVRVNVGGQTRRSAIDTFHGNAVIEFENDLAATGASARKQVARYSAGVWASEGQPYRPLIGVASDGFNWEVYRPQILTPPDSVPKAEDIVLGEPVQKFTVTCATQSEFYFWLQALLFRPQQMTPTADLFSFDFGDASPLYAEAKESLYAAWVKSAQTKDRKDRTRRVATLSSLHLRL